MIASVSGTTAHVGLDHVVIEVGGVGLLVRTTPTTAAGLRLGVEARLFTSLIVREDSLTLFGFSAPAERDLFDTVQTVSGVGPGWPWRCCRCTTRMPCGWRCPAGISPR